MNKEAIFDCLIKFRSLVHLSDESLEMLVERLSRLDKIDIVKDICNLVYRNLGHDKEKYEAGLAIIVETFSEYGFTVDSLKDKLNDLYQNNIKGNMSIEENHELLQSTLVELTKILNKNNVDYYLVGSLSSFIKLGIPLFRYHDDIDILVCEDDLDKVAEAMSLMEYFYNDDRFPDVDRLREMQESHPPHVVMGKNPNNEFHIGFIPFRKTVNGNIAVRDYVHKINGEEVEVDIFEKLLGPEDIALRYDTLPIDYNDTYFRCASVELTYLLKGYTSRAKDFSDRKVLEPYINKEVLEAIKEHKSININIYNAKEHKNKKSLNL